MTKTKLNANKRKLAVKVFNRHYANEDNILKTEYYNQKKAFKNIIENAHNTAINIINRNYNIDDIVSLKNHDRKYNLENVRDDACFYLQSDKGVQNHDNQTPDYPNKQFSFELFGGTSEYDGRLSGQKFAFAYYHDHLKQKEIGRASCRERV